MKIKLIAIAIVAMGVIALLAQTASAADWMFKPSYFSHDPDTGARVTQYAAKPPVYKPVQPILTRSGYQRSWSWLRDGRGSFDLRHINNEWGRYASPWYNNYYGRFYFGPYTRSRAYW